MNRLIEAINVKPELTNKDLPSGVLCRVTYPICNLGQLNHNRRMYPKGCWEKTLADPDFQYKIKNRTLFGMAEHPTEPTSNLEKTSHIITEMWIDDEKGKVFQTLDVVDTPFGRIIDALLRAGSNVGVSTRANGDCETRICEDTDEEYDEVLAETFDYVTTDFTHDPSTFNTIPMDVQRNITTHVKEGLESNKIDKDFALHILESLNVKEARQLNESIQRDSDKEVIKTYISEKVRDGKTRDDILKEGRKILNENYLEMLDSFLDPESEEGKIIFGESKRLNETAKPLNIDNADISPEHAIDLAKKMKKVNEDNRLDVDLVGDIEELPDNLQELYKDYPVTISQWDENYDSAERATVARNNTESDNLEWLMPEATYSKIKPLIQKYDLQVTTDVPSNGKIPVLIEYGNIGSEDMYAAINHLVNSLGLEEGKDDDRLTMVSWGKMLLDYFDNPLEYFNEIGKMEDRMKKIQKVDKSKLSGEELKIYDTLMPKIENHFADGKEVNEDLIPGGKADMLMPEDIAKKHGVSVDVIDAQLEKGIEVEMEHTYDPAKAREIALDHLSEIADYYDRLAGMEKDAGIVESDKEEGTVDLAIAVYKNGVKTGEEKIDPQEVEDMRDLTDEEVKTLKISKEDTNLKFITKDEEGQLKFAYGIPKLSESDQSIDNNAPDDPNRIDTNKGNIDNNINKLNRGKGTDDIQEDSTDGENKNSLESDIKQLIDDGMNKEEIETALFSQYVTSIRDMKATAKFQDDFDTAYARATVKQESILDRVRQLQLELAEAIAERDILSESYEELEVKFDKIIERATNSSIAHKKSISESKNQINEIASLKRSVKNSKILESNLRSEITKLQEAAKRDKDNIFIITEARKKDQKIFKEQKAKESLKSYANGIIDHSGIKLSENQLSLITECSTKDEILEMIDDFRQASNEPTLHSNVSEDFLVEVTKNIDTDQLSIDTMVESAMDSI